MQMSAQTSRNSYNRLSLKNLDRTLRTSPSRQLAAPGRFEQLESRQFLITTPVPITDAFIVDVSDGSQNSVAVASGENSGGDAFIVWAGSGSGDNQGIFGRKVDGQGKLIGTEIRINDFTGGLQHNPAVAALANGGYVVTWEGQGSDTEFGIFLRTYDVFGNPDSPIINVKSDISVTTGQTASAVTALESGGFVVVWRGTGDDGAAGPATGIIAQHFDADAQPLSTRFQVNASPGTNYVLPSVTALIGDGGYVIAWAEQFSGDIYSQRYSSKDETQGANVLLAKHDTYLYTEPSVTALTIGGYLLTWTSFSGQDGDGFGVYGQLFSSSGATKGVPFQVSTYTTGDQFGPSASYVMDAGFVITWTSVGQDGSGHGIYGQRYDSLGNRVGSEFLINQYTTNHQTGSAVIATFDGSFLTVFSGASQEGSSIYGRYFEVLHVNKEPQVSFTSPVIANRNSGHTTLPGFVVFDPGHPSESDQTAQYDVLGISDKSLFSVAPSLSPDGTLQFTLADNVSGTSVITVLVTDSGGTAFAGQNQNKFDFTITVPAPNTKPYFENPSTTLTAIEDSSIYFAFGEFPFNPGSPSESEQTPIKFNVLNVSNPGLFSVLPQFNSDGVLVFKPAANLSGSSKVTINVQDSGGTANGGVDTSDPYTFIINVTPVNDAPTIVAVDPPTILEDVGFQTISNWAKFNPGPADESGQTPTFTVNLPAPGAADLFTKLPQVDANGTLTYQVAPHIYGDIVFTVTVKDSGPTSIFDQNTSASYPFTIHVTPVNDPPTFTASPIDSVNENSGTVTIKNWAKASPGPNESGQTILYHLTSLSNPILFLDSPVISDDGTLTFTPFPFSYGEAIFTLVAKDNGGTANGGQNTSLPQTFTISINHVPAPKVNVVSTLPNLGNGVSDGSTFTSTENGTNFGTSYQSIAPGSVSRTFTVNNPGDLPLKISNFSVPTGFTITEGLSDTIAPGKSDTFTVSLSTQTPGEFSGQVQFDTNTAVGSFNFALTGLVEPGEFHTFTSKTALKDRTFLDENNNKVVFALTGPGNGTLFITPDKRLLSLALDGTLSVSSSLTITTTKNTPTGTGISSLTAIDVSGGLLALNAASTALHGSFNASANIKTLTLGDVVTHHQSNIIINGSVSDKTTITLGRLSEVSIRTDATITSFKAIDWLDSNGLADEFIAASLGSFSITGRAATKTAPLVRGDLQADIRLTLPAPVSVSGKAVVAPLVSAITISGDSSSIWALGAHKLGSATVKGTSSGGGLFANAVGSLTVTGDVSNFIAHIDKDFTSFKARHAQNVEFNITGALGTVSVNQWSGGSIFTGKLTSFTTTGLAGPVIKGISTPILSGDFTGDLTIVGLSSTANAQTLGSLTIKGSVTGNGESTGLSADWSITGGVGAIRIGGDVTGLVFETKHKTANKGNLASLSVTGEIRDTSIDIAGKTGAISMGSSDHLTFSADAEILSYTALKITLENVLVSSLAIGAINVGAWQSGSITAPKVTSITAKGVAATKTTPAIAGDFTGKVDISAIGLKTGTLALGSVSIAGTLGGYGDNKTWSINGKTGPITVGALANTTIDITGDLTSYTSKLTSDNSHLNVSGSSGPISLGGADHLEIRIGFGGKGGDLASFTSTKDLQSTTLWVEGNIGALTTGNWDGGSITARKVAGITAKATAATKTASAVHGDWDGVAMEITGDNVKIGQNAVGPINIAGQVNLSTWHIHGNAGAVSVGSFYSSAIYVGVSEGVNAGTVKSSHFTLFGGKAATLAGFTVTGKNVPAGHTSFSNSDILTGSLTNASLKLVNNETLSGYGFYVFTKIGNYTRQTGNPPPNSVVRVTNKTTPGTYDQDAGYRLVIVA